MRTVYTVIYKIKNVEYSAGPYNTEAEAMSNYLDISEYEGVEDCRVERFFVRYEEGVV